MAHSKIVPLFQLVIIYFLYDNLLTPFTPRISCKCLLTACFAPLTNFVIPSTGSNATGNRDKDKAESHIRKSLHLLTQVCISEPSLLMTLFSLYGASASASAMEKEQTNVVSRQIVADGDVSKVLRDGDKDDGGTQTTATEGSATTAITSDTTITDVGSSNKYELICVLIEKELESIIPVLARRMGPAEVFSLVASPHSGSGVVEPLARPLLERTLETMHPDYNTPATSEMVEKVQAYLQSPLFQTSFGVETEQSTTATATATDTTSLCAVRDAAEIRLLVPLLGGLPSADVLSLLPRILRTFSDTSSGSGSSGDSTSSSDTALLNAFRRIYAARPPSVPKATLFAALHRYVNLCYTILSFIFFTRLICQWMPTTNHDPTPSFVHLFVHSIILLSIDWILKPQD